MGMQIGIRKQRGCGPNETEVMLDSLSPLKQVPDYASCGFRTDY